MTASSEDRIHRRVVAELRRTFLRRGYERGAEPFFHAANEGSRPNARYRSKLHSLGLSPGVPDLIIVHPVTLDGALYPGAALELKTETGRASAEQLRWLGYWQAAGFFAAVLRGSGECGRTLHALGLIDQEQALRFSE